MQDFGEIWETNYGRYKQLTITTDLETGEVEFDYSDGEDSL